MPTVNLSPLFNGWQGFTPAGLPLSGGFINTYIAGTSTPLATYTTIAGNVANSNPIQLGPDGRPPFEIWLTQGQSYKLVLTDSLGLNPLTYDNISGIGDGSSFLVALATAAGSTLIGWMQAGAGAVLRTVSNKLREVYLPSVKDYGAVGDGVAVDLGAIQAAYAANSDVYWPNGTYNLGNSTWTPPTSMRMVGQSRRGVKVTRTGAGPIITFQIGTFDPYIENIEFTGVGNTGLTVAATAGTFQGYLIRPHITSCDFDYDLAYGINADLIFATIEKSTFGYYGVGALPAPGASTFVAIRSYVYPATANYTNLNTLRNNIFQRSGALTQAAVDISGGAAWLFDSNDWEGGGQVLNAVNVQTLKFIGSNWMEANAATNGLIEIGTCVVAPVFDGVSIYNNICANIWKYTTGSTRGLVIRHCDITMISPTYALLDTTLLVQTLPGDGSVTWHDNNVVSGNALNKVVTGTEFRGGKTSSRVTASIDTTGSGTILYCSDPGASLSRAGVGDVTLTVTQPLGSSANNVAAICTGRTADAIRAVGVTATTIRVQAFTNAGAAVDGVIGVVAYGA